MATLRHRDGAAVGGWVVGDDEIGLPVPGERQREIERAGLLWIRERDRWKPRVWRRLTAYRHRWLESGHGEGPQDDLRAYAVHGRVHDPQCSTRRTDQTGDSGHVRVDDRVVQNRIAG